MPVTNPKDKLFYSIIKELAKDIIEDAQLAADRTIDISTQFLGEESQSIADDFRTLCVEQEKIDELRQNGNSSPDEQQAPGAAIRPYKTPAYTMQLGILRKNMQHVVHQNAAIRAEVKVILSAMQFSELLRQHLDGLLLSFHAMTHADHVDQNRIRSEMQKTMHTFDERKAFHEHVMRESMPSEDQEITQDLIDQLIG